MTRWIIQKKLDGNAKFKEPILVEGLPGIGNVGKIAVDFMIDSLKPNLLYKIHSHSFPHSVFLTENNQIELPSVNIFDYKAPSRDILFLSGDVQPVEEREKSCMVAARLHPGSVKFLCHRIDQTFFSLAAVFLQQRAHPVLMMLYVF